MNFVQLVNSLRIEVGASGRDVTTVEGSLAAETERLKRWIAAAWLDIQRQHQDWNFLYVESTHSLVPGVTVINPTEYAAGGVAEWVVNSFWIARPDYVRRQAQRMEYIDYYYWRDFNGNDTTQIGMPQSFTIHPQTEAIHLSMTPDLAYELFYDYRRTPQELTLDEDTPIMPARYHDLIVAWAMRKYGLHEAAGEKITQAQEVIGRIFPALEMDQLPDITLGTLV